MVRLDIFSDPVCPWCLIGKARLDRALEARPDHPFEVEWHPFRLNPDMPPGGLDHATYIEAKFGSRRAVAEAYATVMEAAAGSGVTIDLEVIKRSPDTLDAHRLIHWAGLEGRQTAMVSTLLRAYWAQGLDIGDPATLVRLAEDAGLDPVLTARLLATDADRDTVIARDCHARSRGITAVPTFIIGNSYVVSGAQPTEVWLQVIDDIAALPPNPSRP